MTTLEMAKEAFASRGSVDAWFKDALPNFEAFAKMVRDREREACELRCAKTPVLIPGHLDIDTLFQQWFENEFADNIDEGSRTHTNLHSAFDAGAQSVKPQLDALYKSNEELRHILYAKDKELRETKVND